MTKRRSCSILIAIVWFAVLRSAVAASGDSKTIQESLLGTWEMTAVTDSGTIVPSEQVRGGKTVFSENKMTFISPDGKEETPFAIKIDATKRPIILEIRPSKDQSVIGILQINDDELQLCWQQRPSASKPSKFEAPKDSGLMLMVMKRVKPQ